MEKERTGGREEKGKKGRERKRSELVSSFLTAH